MPSIKYVTWRLQTLAILVAVIATSCAGCQSENGGVDRELATVDDASLSVGSQSKLTTANPRTLTKDELAAGFRLMPDAQPGAYLIGRRDSRSWLELPQPQVNQNLNSENLPHEDSPAGDFVGPEACVECHAEYVETFQHTAHFHASSPANRETIRGSFAATENTLKTSQPELSFVMSQAGDQCFQTVHFGELSRHFPFDIVTGSRSQSYLFWQEDRLYQMHVSYFSDLDSWVNSPGYHDGTAWYTREIIPKCMACHSTYMESIPGATNRYDKSKSLLGITCERCHGPAREHVAYHRSHTDAGQARHITNPANLDRERSNDLCAQCHLGTANPIQDPFAFRPGDRLDDFWEAAESSPASNADPIAETLVGAVHSSNQLQRLQMSQCFQQSEMTCVMCHDPHENERGDLKLQ